jgi:hypothetical protein
MAAPSFKRNSLADRGKEAEKAAHDYLKGWASGHTDRDFERLADTKSAGRIIKQAKADFEALRGGQYVLLECKQTAHDYRLERSKLTQLPRLRKQALAGATCVVLVYHSASRAWHCVPVEWLMRPNDKGSWDLRPLAAFQTCGEALSYVVPGVFGI